MEDLPLGAITAKMGRDFVPRTLDEICKLLGQPATVVEPRLTSLEMLGSTTRVSIHQFVVKTPHFDEDYLDYMSVVVDQIAQEGLESRYGSVVHWLYSKAGDRLRGEVAPELLEDWHELALRLVAVLSSYPCIGDHRVGDLLHVASVQLVPIGKGLEVLEHLERAIEEESQLGIRALLISIYEICQRPQRNMNYAVDGIATRDVQ